MATTKIAPVGAKPTAPTPIPAEQTTTVSGYAINILAFIPVDKKDLARQIEVPTVLQAVMSGEKDLTALAPYLYKPEVRNNFINKRYPISEAREMLQARIANETPVEKEMEEVQPQTDTPELEA